MKTKTSAFFLFLNICISAVSFAGPADRVVSDTERWKLIQKTARSLQTGQLKLGKANEEIKGTGYSFSVTDTSIRCTKGSYSVAVGILSSPYSDESVTGFDRGHDYDIHRLPADPTIPGITFLSKAF